MLSTGSFYYVFYLDVQQQFSQHPGYSDIKIIDCFDVVVHYIFCLNTERIAKMKNIIDCLIANPRAIVGGGVGDDLIPAPQSPDTLPARKAATNRTDVALPDRFVSMSNAIARSAQGLSLVKKRIIALAMAKTDSMSARDATTSHGGWSMRLTAGEYAETYDVDPTTAYGQLQTGCDALLTTIWRTVAPDERHARKKNKTAVVVTKGQWLSRAEYRSHEGSVDIVVHPDVSPHLLALRSHFVTYKLKQASALRSVYAWRLFECLLSWRDKGVWRVSVDDFIEMMDAPVSCSKDFRNLRVRVIEPAIAELEAKNNINIKCSIVKAGRKVTDLEFTFATDPQGRLEL